MGEWLSGFLDSGFLPHGHCWYWRPDILWTHVVSDATIAVSYFSIPAALAYFVGRRRDLAYRWIFVLFALFIVACGMTHAMGLLVVWKPYYVLDGAVKAATALISLTTAVVLWPLIPRALALPSPEALRLANEELETARATLERRVEERTSTLAEANARLQREVAERARMEEERRGLEARIQQTQKLESLGVLAGGIAHDFNNLLMGVLGNAGLALMEMSPEAPGRESVRLIETAAQRAAELTNQMLAYSGKGRFVIERLDLSRLVSEMAHLLHVSISKRAALNLRTPAGLPPIEGDAAQIRQVVMNLITNASDALGDGTGTISVTTGRCAADAGYFDRSFIKDDLPEGEYVFVEVSDTGCGMDGETAAKIFDPFFTTKFAGRGLGLAAVLGIVRGHRGAVRVYSEPGRGTTFKVLFPAAAPADGRSAEAIAPAPAAEAASDGAVLIIDDEESVRSVARRVLASRGVRTYVAADGPEGLALFREHADDVRLVVLDLTMPNMSGEEVFSELRRMRPDLPVILSSGFSEQESTGRFAGRGIAAFIQKPYRPKDLLDVALRLLGAEPPKT